MRHGVARTLFLIFVLILTWHVSSYSVALKPEVVEKLRREGRLQEWIERWESAAQRGMYAQNPANALRLAKRTPGDVDTLKPLVICVEFTDNPRTYDTSSFSTLLFSQGFVVPTGSFRDYYLENSYGQHDPQGGVYGWVTAPHEYTYYTGGDNGLGPPPNAQTLVQDVVNAIDPYVNFADYDYDGDLWVDGLMIVHAGPGAEETDNDWQIWSHRWVISQQWKDDVRLESYTMQPEKHAGGSLIDIGVFCHEWGHDLGIFWEEYDTDYSSEGLGDWSVMAIGCYNGPSGSAGQKPAHHSAFCKQYLGWTNVINVTSNLTMVEILQAETEPVAYRLWTSGSGSSQYFLVENRQKTRFDSHLPGEGLLIYHVDEDKATNDQEWCPDSFPDYHFRTALEQADGWFGIEGCGGSPNQGDGGDPFPGYWVKRAFDDTTTPSSRDYYDNSTQVAVWNISNSDSAMYANLDVTWSRPNLKLESFSFDDNAGGDGDGRAEPEETVELYFSLSNTWKDFAGAWVIASADTEGISFSTDSVYLGDIISGNTVDNSGNPLVFYVAAGFPSKIVDFTLHICGDGGAYCTDRIQSASVGPPEILLVDDDNHISGDSNYAPIYEQRLDAMGAVYETWDKASKPKTVDLSPYPIVIWFTGNSRSGILPQQDVQDLKDYLDSGGNLFLTSQDAVQKLITSGESLDSIFLKDYLHVGYFGDYSMTVAQGVPGDLIGNDLYLSVGGSDDYAPNNQVSKDILVPDGQSIPVINYAGVFFAETDSVAAIRYQSSFRVVLFGFGFEAIDSTARYWYGHNLSKPVQVMDRVLNWLRGSSDVFDEEDDLVSRPRAFELHQNYPNPFNPATTIRLTVHRSRFTGSSRTTLKIYNVRGQLVRTLVDEDAARRTYSVTWDGKDQRGREVSSGIYFYQLTVGDESEVKKMVLLK